MVAELPPNTGAARRWAARIALASALALSLGFVPYRVLDPTGPREVRELERKLHEVRAAQRALDREIRTYRREIRGLRDDPAALEDAARNDLGMVRPDEIVIRIERGEVAR